MEINIQYILEEQKALLKLQNEKKAAHNKYQQASKNTELAIKAQSLANKIASHKSSYEQVVKLNNAVEAARQTWIQQATDTFRKAALAGVRIDMYSDCIALSMSSPCGIYVQQRYKAGQNDETASSTVPSQVDANIRLKRSVRKDLVARAKKLYPHWKMYDLAVRAYWRFVGRLAGNNDLSPYIGATTNDTFTTNYYENIIKLNADIKECLDKLAETNSGLIGPHTTYNNDICKRAKDAECNAKKELDDILKECQNREAKIESAKVKLAEIDPIEANFSIPGSFKTGTYDKHWLDLVKKAAAGRRGLPFIPADNEYIDCTHDKNLIIASQDNAQMNDLKQLVTTFLLAFPIRRVHVTIFEHNVIVPQMLYNLNDAVCEVITERDFNGWNNFIARICEKYGELEGNANPDVPSEIVVLTGYDNDIKGNIKNLKQIIEDGSNRGIYFVILPIKDYDFTQDAYYKYFNEINYTGSAVLDRKAVKEELDEEASRGEHKVNKKIPTTLEKLVMQYIEDGCTTIENKVYEGISEGKLYTRTPIKDLVTEQPDSAANTLVVPFAEGVDGREMNLRFATVDHFSTFIIGRSGSGKSYLLHNILTNMMLKYDTSTVELIVMDFKEGGVELDYYRDVPHVSTLLVNGRDSQIVTEIMESIDQEMRRRGELLNEIGKKDIDEYNKSARKEGKEQMKHLVVFADECHRLFANESTKDRIREIVSNIARQGRSQGVNMVFATQLYSGSGIPEDAIKQFSDFLLMNCTSDDVSACGITNSDVKSRVEHLIKGQVVHYSGGVFQQGNVYNYAGHNGVYKEKTLEVLLEKYKCRYTKTQPQAYFNAGQRFYMRSNVLQAISARNSRIPVALLGRKLTVKEDGMIVKFKKELGCNLLIMGINEELQAERVLWSAVMSLYYSHKKINKPAQFNILSTFPDEEDQEFVKQRNGVINSISELGKVTFIKEDERGEEIERIGKIVRERHDGASTEESIYLILPNQEFYRRALLTRLKGAKEQIVQSAFADNHSTDNLGFIHIDKGDGTQSAASHVGSTNTTSTSATLQDELKFILNNGPEVRVHTIIQVSSPDKIFMPDRDNSQSWRSEMYNWFTNTVILKSRDSIVPQGVNKQVAALSDDLKSLRAIVYNPDEAVRTFVPYDFPGGKEDSSKEDIFEFITH